MLRIEFSACMAPAYPAVLPLKVLRDIETALLLVTKRLPPLPRIVDTNVYDAELSSKSASEIWKTEFLTAATPPS
jgi:hypothetical protein